MRHLRVEPPLLRALRVVALVESCSFVVLLVGSVLKRTTSLNAVPVLGPLHGTLFLLLGALVVLQLRRLGWSLWFAAVMLTVGSPGAHFAVRATRPADVPEPAGVPEPAAAPEPA